MRGNDPNEGIRGKLAKFKFFCQHPLASGAYDGRQTMVHLPRRPRAILQGWRAVKRPVEDGLANATGFWQPITPGRRGAEGKLANFAVMSTSVLSEAHGTLCAMKRKSYFALIGNSALLNQ